MAVAQELSAANLSTPQGALNPLTPTLASGATIAPTSLVTIVTGTTQVATITPPAAGMHILILIFTDASPGATLTSGNIKLATTVVRYKALILTYDPVTALYYPSY